jgi:hypothetical protein
LTILQASQLRHSRRLDRLLRHRIVGFRARLGKTIVGQAVRSDNHQRRLDDSSRRRVRKLRRLL